MTRAATRRAVGAYMMVAATSLASSARAAETHRIAAVDPDAELTHALDLALAPWGASIIALRLQAPGGTMPFAFDRARAIAEDAHADVVVWVSGEQGEYALWIYDVASDHIGSRRLESHPPFDPATAAAVALAVKTLLRGTVVAPVAERFGAPPPREARWALGVDLAASGRFGTPTLAEARLGLVATAWPASWGHRWGIEVSAETGAGAAVATDGFTGSLRDQVARLAVVAHVPLLGAAGAAAFEASMGGGLHLVELDGVVRSDSSSTSSAHLDAALEPRLGLCFRALGGRLELSPWVGVSLLTRWQRYLVEGARTLEVGPFVAQGALTVAVAIP